MLRELLMQLELRRMDREAGFILVARKLAADESVSASTVEKLLIDTGKTPDDLSESVELYKRRFLWDEQRNKAAPLSKERARLEQQIAAEDRKLEAAETAHSEATGPLYCRLEEIRHAVNEASDARRQLISTCADEKLKGELADVQGRLSRLQAEATSLRTRGELVKRASSDLETADRLAAGLVPRAPTGHIDRLREGAARKRETGEHALAELPTVEKQIAAAEREEAAVYERMTLP